MATRLDQEIEQPEKIVEQGLDFCKVVAMRLDRQIEQLENIVEQQLEVRGITRPVGGTGPEAARGHRNQRPGPLRYGLPCASCRLYYAAELVVCPICGCDDRVSPVIERIQSVAML